MNALSTFQSNGELFIIKYVEDTPNDMDAFIKPISWFYYCYRIFTASCVIFNFLTIIVNIKVIHTLIEKERALTFSGVCLYSALIGNICRFVTLLDPFSFYGLIDWTSYEILNSFSDSLHVISSLSSIIVWLDMIGIRQKD